MNKTHVLVMEKTSSTNRSLQANYGGQMSASQALQMTDICSLSQNSDHYNSAMALLLDWGKKTSDNPVGGQTLVTTKDCKWMCQVKSEDISVHSNSISVTSFGSNSNSAEVAVKVDPSVSDVAPSQTCKDVLPLHSEKEVPGSITEDVFCCILGWSAQMTGIRLCSCKDQSNMLTTNTLSGLSSRSAHLNGSCYKEPEVASLSPENSAASLSSASELPEGLTVQANLSPEGPPTPVMENPFALKKRDAGTSPLQYDPPVLHFSGAVKVQKAGEENENLPKIDISKIKTEPELDEYTPNKETMSLASKIDVGRSPLLQDSHLKNPPDPPNGLKSKEHTHMLSHNVLNIKKESDLEESVTGGNPSSLGGINQNDDAGKSPLQKDPPILNLPTGLAPTSEAEPMNLPCKDTLNIKKESDLEEEVTDGNPSSLKLNCDVGKSSSQKEPPIINWPSGLMRTSEAEPINLPCKDVKNIKKESDLDESADVKEPNVFCCILSWLAQGSGKQVQCNCAGEVKTEPSLPTSESSASETKDSSSVTKAKQTVSQSSCIITKRSLRGYSKSIKTSESVGQQSEPPQLPLSGLLGPQPETSSNCDGDLLTKWRRNISLSENASGLTQASEVARLQLQNHQMTWLDLLGLQSKMDANSKGKLKRKSPIPEKGSMGLSQTQLCGRGALNIQSAEWPDATVVPSKRLKSKVLSIIKAKSICANGNKEQKCVGLAAGTERATKGNLNVGDSGNATRQSGRRQGGLAADTNQHGKVDLSEKKSGKCQVKPTADATRPTGKRTGKADGSAAKVTKPKGKIAAGIKLRAGSSKQKAGSAGTSRSAGKTGSLSKKAKQPDLKVASRTGPSTSNNPSPSGQKRKKPSPKKGQGNKIILLEPNTEVVQQTVDITLNYLSQIFFLEKLF